MASIFDLKTSVEELSSANEGTSRMDIEQHPPTRSVQGSAFPGGAIHFRWQTSGQKWWMPSKSYIRMRCLLGKSDAAGVVQPLTKADNIAPNMDLCASLFQSMEFKINDKTVSRVGDFVAQVDAVEQRLRKSSSHLKTIGYATNFWQDQFKVRQQQVIVDGNNEVIAPTIKTRLELGFAPTQRFALSATGVLTQSVDTTVDLRTVFEIGDRISILLDAARGFQTLQVIDVPSANDIQTEYASETDIIAAAVKAFSRIRDEVIEGNTSRRMTEFELTWQPPLSIFKVGHAMPSGKYEIVLNPQTASVYKKYAIQSIGASKTANLNSVGVAPSANADFQFEVSDMYFYCSTVEGPRYDEGTFLLDLEQTSCQSEKINNASFSQRNFDVSPSTYALTAAFQDLRAGNSTQSSVSQFKSYNAALTASEELKLERFFINYAGQNLPSPDADPSFTTSKDYTVQRYYDTQVYSGAYFDSGGAETIQEWHERGAYYYFAWARDGTDRSTRVTVNSGFQSTTDTTNMRLLLFSHSKQIARVRVMDGRVVDVQLEDA